MAAQSDYQVIVIGAGAAGLFAATEAARAGARTLLLEKNRQAGVKILASGGTRCNVTSTLPIRELGLLFGKRQERFLRHGLHLCNPGRVRQLLADEGVATDDFPLQKVFPRSGRAADVLHALLRRLARSGAELALEEPVLDLEKRSAGGFNVRLSQRCLVAERVVVTSGGMSFPKTGCTGDGYPWLRKLGHKIGELRPALVPLVVEAPWVRQLTGIAVENVTVSALDAKGKKIFSRRRPLLFTHRGLSGPGPMDISTPFSQRSASAAPSSPRCRRPTTTEPSAETAEADVPPRFVITPSSHR